MLEPRGQQDRGLLSSESSVTLAHLASPTPSPPAPQKTLATTAQHRIVGLGGGEAGQCVRGGSPVSTLFTTTTRTGTHRAALPRAEQLLLEEDVLFPEVRQTPELAGRSPCACQAGEAGAGVVHPPPREGHPVTQRMALLSQIPHRRAHSQAADPQADRTAHPSSALLISVAGPGDDGSAPRRQPQPQQQQQHGQGRRGSAQAPHGAGPRPRPPALPLGLGEAQRSRARCSVPPRPL